MRNAMHGFGPNDATRIAASTLNGGHSGDPLVGAGIGGTPSPELREAAALDALWLEGAFRVARNVGGTAHDAIIESSEARRLRSAALLAEGATAEELLGRKGELSETERVRVLEGREPLRVDVASFDLQTRVPESPSPHKFDPERLTIDEQRAALEALNGRQTI